MARLATEFGAVADRCAAASPTLICVTGRVTASVRCGIRRAWVYEQKPARVCHEQLQHEEARNEDPS